LTPRRSLVCLVALVVAASVAATAHGLYAVAVTSGVPRQVAVLYPLITDGLALVAYWATKQLDSARYPWLVIVVAAGLSGLAQAVNLAGLGESPTWLRFGVGYWPAVAVLFAAHLLWLVGRPRAGSKEERNGEADEGREGRGAAGVPGGAAGTGREQGQDGDGSVPAGEPAGDRRGEGRPLVPQVALTATDAGGSDSPVPGPSAPGLAALADSNGNGHGVTLKAQAEREALAYLERHGVLPSENVLAGLAGCSRGTARNALTPLKKG
jgi:hypothetical protein